MIFFVLYRDFVFGLISYKASVTAANTGFDDVFNTGFVLMDKTKGIGCRLWKESLHQKKQTKYEDYFFQELICWIKLVFPFEWKYKT